MAYRVPTKSLPAPAAVLRRELVAAVGAATRETPATAGQSAPRGRGRRPGGPSRGSPAPRNLDTGLPGRISVVVVDDETMRVLNRDFHGCDEPTDVLAFALDRPPGPAGEDAFDAEVIVSLDTARLEAAERGVDPVSELLLYAVHGALHLAGEDDHDPASYRRMHTRALSILAALGRSNTIDPPESKLGENAP